MKNIRLNAGAIVLLFAANVLFAQNSVLSTGNWYKIAVENTGIQKITYENLVSYGINPGQINPKHIRLYGNGNGMLPEDNDEFRYDDLQENSILVFGEEDEIFDLDDYILFYGEGPVKWNLNEETGWFGHEMNLYSGFTYYFLTTDLGEGKRIETQFSTVIPPTYISTGFNDYYYHEEELENLIHSGRKWFGERFEEITQYSFPVVIPNLETSFPVCISTNAAARSDVLCMMEIAISGQPIDTLKFSPVNTGNLNADFAKERTDTTCSLVGNNEFEINLIYFQPNDSSVAWLDYFTLNFRRNLVFETGQMMFRDLGSAGPGMVTMFQITAPDNNLKIWNVTNPLTPVSVDYIYSNNTAEFTLETDSLLEFIAFDVSQFYTPQFDGMVANQNLHGIEPPDMIIVTHGDFIAEAQQLAGFRESHDGISTFVTTPGKIYNEFSSGAQDITAIRDFVKYLYDKSNGEKPEYLLLFGDGSFDYKNISYSDSNYIPVWESPESLNPVNTYCSDDFYGEFDEEDKTSMMRIGIGRLPVKSQTEAIAVVDKIIHYSSAETAFGSWRNEICFIADDEDNNLHLNDTEKLANIVDTIDPDFNISKIYLDAYELQITSNGQFYPDVNQAITDKINEGVNIIDYTGHGSYNGLAFEMVLTEDDLENWENYDFYPFMIMATGDFNRFDDPQRYSLGEKAILLENKGMSAILGSTGATYAGANYSFQKTFLETILNNPGYTLGKSLKLTKYQIGGNDNNRKYCLFGDPSMRPAIPECEIITGVINGVPVTEPLDTINPGEQLIVSGYIVDAEGEPFYNFNGSLEVRIFDHIDTITTLGNNPGSNITDFTVRDSILLTLNTEILNGQFAFSINLPYTLDEEYGTLKLSYYGTDFPMDARGQFQDIVAGGPPNAISENKATDEIIHLYPTLVISRLNYLAVRNIDNLKLTIYDLTGRKIYAISEKNIPKGKKSSLDISALKPGMYIIQIHADERFGIFKVIRQ